MKKLKTFNELVIDWNDDSERVRQEAIKWLDQEKTVRMNGNDFILVFFNITEDDLKLSYKTGSEVKHEK